MIAEIGNTRIRLRFSFAATVTLMLYFCDENVVLTTLFASLFHEAGHIFFLRLFGEAPADIELSAFGISITRPSHSRLSYKKEATVAMGGIIFNLIAACICAAVYAVCKLRPVYLAVPVNIIVAAVNSLPNRYLDAGRALYYLLLGRSSHCAAEKIIDTVSYVFAVLLLAFWLFFSIFVRVNISLGAVTLYLVLITFKGKVGK
ncbi:MAG: hypothetical protein IKJ27_11490 [Clostridia bacterium]|nr:hypothetical protein [Clostridia bacterium]